VLLARLSGQTDIVVGVPVAGRSRVDLERVVGALASMLPLRTDLQGDPTFAALLSRVRDTALDAFAHQATPFAVLVERLAPHRDPSHNAVFQVTFGLQHWLTGKPRLPGIHVAWMDAQNHTSKVDLALEVLEAEDGGLTAGFQY